MSSFIDALKSVNPAPSARRWIYVPYDQLGDLQLFHRVETGSTSVPQAIVGAHTV